MSADRLRHIQAAAVAGALADPGWMHTGDKIVVIVTDGEYSDLTTANLTYADLITCLETQLDALRKAQPAPTITAPCPAGAFDATVIVENNTSTAAVQEGTVDGMEH